MGVSHGLTIDVYDVKTGAPVNNISVASVNNVSFDGAQIYGNRISTTIYSGYSISFTIVAPFYKPVSWSGSSGESHIILNMSKEAALEEGAAVTAQEASLIAQGQDIAAKAGYLESKTAIWSSAAAYKAEATETTKEINLFNSILETYKPSTPPPAAAGTGITTSGTIGKALTLPIIILIGAAALLFFIFRR